MPDIPRWPKLQTFLDKWLPTITGFCLITMLLSLKLHFLDYFISTTWHGKLGLDFFSVPRAFINLCHGKSIYDTWANNFGPYASWFPYHPLTAVALGSWLSLFSPWVSYSVFVVCSVAVLGWCAFLAGTLCPSGISRKALYFLFFCSPPAYLLLWNGQMHVFTVLSVSLICYELAAAAKDPSGDGVRPLLILGVLVCLFTKPIILPALPLLFAVRSFRKTMCWALGVYAVVSAVFVLIPFLNPASLGLSAEFNAFLHPEFILDRMFDGKVMHVQYRLDYAHDNAIHWLNMRNLTGVVRADVFEFQSVSSFLIDLFGDIPAALFKLPLALAGFLSLALFCVKDEVRRNRTAFYVFALCILGFYIAYDSVYEYHFTTLLAVLAFLFALYEGGAPGFCRPAVKLTCATGALFYAPTAYFWVRNPAFGYHGARAAAWPLRAVPVVLAGHPYGWALWLLRLDRALPVLVLFFILSYLAVVETFYGENT